MTESHCNIAVSQSGEIRATNRFNPVTPQLASHTCIYVNKDMEGQKRWQRHANKHKYFHIQWECLEETFQLTH